MELEFTGHAYGEGRGRQGGVTVEFPTLAALLTVENVNQVIKSGGMYVPLRHGDDGWTSDNGVRSYATAKAQLKETVEDILADLLPEDAEFLAVSMTDRFKKGTDKYPAGTIGWTIRDTRK